MAVAVKGVSITSTKLNDVILGTDYDDNLKGYSDGTVLVGGKGNDIYVVVNNANVTRELYGEGIDEVHSYANYTLSANIENLVVSYTGLYGGGNNLDNKLIGVWGSQILFGAGGNDTLTGGLGGDTFIMRVGNGNDTITDFEAGTVGTDVVQLSSYGFTSFESVKTAMVQSGADVILKMGQETLTFKNHAIGDFAADDFKYAMDFSKYKVSFVDNFDTLKFQTEGGAWRPSFYADGSLRTLADNAEKQIYMDPAYKGLGVNPFSINNGVLTIHADTSSAAVKAATGFDYTSGMISSKSGFSQTYGYFESRMQLPSENGTWPAFWLLPQDGSWPPEIDIFEAIGRDDGKVFTTSHTNSTGRHTSVSAATYVGDTSNEFHTYGLLWTKENLVWYIDGEEVFRTKTPDDMHKPMYMIANLAVGGYWPGNPDADFDGADLKIDYMKAYQLDPTKATATTTPDRFEVSDNVVQPTDSTQVVSEIVNSDISYVLTESSKHLNLTGTGNINGTGNAQDNIITGNSGINILTGLDGNDTLIGGGGKDQLLGGKGNDTYIISDSQAVIGEGENQGNDTVRTSVNYTLSANVENVVLTNSATQATGNSLDNSITGNELNNYLAGNAGNDSIFGNAGNDNLAGGAGNDTIDGGAGVDNIQGGAGSDRMTGGTESDTFLFLANEVGNVTDHITDFEGAGVSGGDRLTFYGLGKGSTFTQTNSEVLTGGSVLYTYDLYDTTTRTHNIVEIESQNGKTLTTGDYAFYG